jgi:hypothetical protein
MTSLQAETNEQYHADKSRTSNSMLTDLKESPKSFRDYHITQTRKFKPTDAMRFGHLVHYLALEPEEFSKRYAVVPEGIDRRTTAGKAAWSEFVRSGKEPVKAEDYDRAMGCLEALAAHDTFGEHLVYRNPSALRETRINFQWGAEPCRCKPDLLLIDGEVIWDIKTSRDASPKGFSRSASQLGYFRQSEFYCEAARQKFGKEFRFLFAVVETEYPFHTAVYEPNAGDRMKARQELNELIAQLRFRRETNNWLQPWETGILPLEMPKYYDSEIYDIGEESEELEEVA